MIAVDSRFERDLAVMFEENDITPGLLDVLDQLAGRPAFYSMPVWTRYAQLGFMAEQGYPEVNRQLIRASVAFLERELARRLAAGDARVRDYLLCMVSITGWDLDPGDGRELSGCNDGTQDYITPHIFVGTCAASCWRPSTSARPARPRHSSPHLAGAPTSPPPRSATAVTTSSARTRHLTDGPLTGINGGPTGSTSGSAATPQHRARP